MLACWCNGHTLLSFLLETGLITQWTCTTSCHFIVMLARWRSDLSFIVMLAVWRSGLSFHCHVGCVTQWPVISLSCWLCDAVVCHFIFRCTSWSRWLLVVVSRTAPETRNTVSVSSPWPCRSVIFKTRDKYGRFSCDRRTVTFQSLISLWKLYHPIALSVLFVTLSTEL